MPELSVCFVTTFYPPHHFGGDATGVRRLARGLAARGLRVRVVHSPDAFEMLGGVASQPAPDDRGVEVLPLAAGKPATLSTYLTGTPLGYRRRLEAALDGFDVIYFSNPSLMGGPAGLGLGDGLKIYQTNEHWLLCPTHHLFRYRREICTKRTCWRCTAVYYHRPPQPWRSTGLLARSIQNIDLLQCPSRFTERLHLDAFPGIRTRVMPMPGPDPTDLPPPRPRGDDPYVLFAGRLDPLKGVDRLIAAMRHVRGLRLVIAGAGSQMDALERAASPGPVDFLGPVSQERVLELAAGARALVIPSIGYETFGLAGAEAMAVGTPIVVRDLGPLPELVEDGGGMTFHDETQLASALQSLIDDSDRASAMGERAREVFLKRFSQPVVTQLLLEHIAETAHEAGRSGLAARAAQAAGAGPIQGSA